MNDMVHVKLKEIIHLQEFVKTDELHYKSKRRTVYDFNEYSLPFFKEIFIKRY